MERKVWTEQGGARYTAFCGETPPALTSGAHGGESGHPVNVWTTETGEVHETTGADVVVPANYFEGKMWPGDREVVYFRPEPDAQEGGSHA